MGVFDHFSRLIPLRIDSIVRLCVPFYFIERGTFDPLNIYPPLFSGYFPRNPFVCFVKGREICLFFPPTLKKTKQARGISKKYLRTFVLILVKVVAFIYVLLLNVFVLLYLSLCDQY